MNDNPRPVIPEKSTIHVICFNSKYSTPAADRTLLHVDDERKLKYLKTLPSTDGTYSCQFCSKTFPRLGYLKKHEQVRLSLAFLLCKSDIIVIFITFREFAFLSFGNISKSETLSHSVPSATWLNKIVLSRATLHRTHNLTYCGSSLRRKSSHHHLRTSHQVEHG